MTGSQTFPALTRRIVDEHQQIHFYLDQLRKSLEALGSRVEIETLRRLAAEIRGLKELLLEHFALEDDGGVFRAVVELLPESRSDVDRLFRDHERVLETLEMASVGAQHGQPSEAPVLRESLEGLLAALRDHEHREEALLARALEREGSRSPR